MWQGLWIEVETRERCYLPTPLISEEPVNRARALRWRVARRFMPEREVLDVYAWCRSVCHVTNVSTRIAAVRYPLSALRQKRKLVVLSGSLRFLAECGMRNA